MGVCLYVCIGRYESLYVQMCDRYAKFRVKFRKLVYVGQIDLISHLQYVVKPW